MSTRIVLAQINLTVGDLEGNAAKILEAVTTAQAVQPDLMLFPEMTLSGYPPEDLLLKPGFYEACEKVLAELVPQIACPALIGYPVQECSADGSITRYNAAGFVANGKIWAVYHKVMLPNYAVFDEERYFAPGTQGLNVTLGKNRLGVIICEDGWCDEGPAEDEAAAGADVILCLSASPFYRGKDRVRELTFGRLAKRNHVYCCYCNLVGAQDELVFDGGSMVLDPAGEVVARAKFCEEDQLVFDLPDPDQAQVSTTDKSQRPVINVEVSLNPSSLVSSPKVDAARSLTDLPAENTAVYDALMLGVHDYIHKNGFSGVIIGLSGGIDSALTAAIAVDALGADQVLGVTMPSRYSSDETKSDAAVLARNLGIQFETLPISAVVTAFREQLEPLFKTMKGDPENITDQNIQARARAVYLMALSNKGGRLLLNTSNKSESAVGYGTLYGDMAGGFAAIKDVFKTQVWALSYYVNERHGREVIPVTTIERIPTAELREDQKDSDSIPDYPVLDPILECYIEKDLTFPEIVAAGHDADTVREIIRLVDRAEFKRRQSALGVRVTPKAFGKDRRLPVTNRFRHW